MITETNLVSHLKNILVEELKKLIDNDYVLWDIPYYSNIGDVLIWEGTLSILRKIPYKCLNQASKETCAFPPLSKSTIILLSGGGNFGDLYPTHQQFKLNVIKKYPNNKIIILPQSIWYKSYEIFENEKNILNGHQHLTFCVRDEYSFNFLSSKLRTRILLLPDMAFGIPHKNYKNHNSGKRILFLKRIDSELTPKISYSIFEEGKEVHDWPTFEKSPFFQKIMYMLVGLSKRIGNKYVKKITDYYGNKIYRPTMVKIGIKFLSRYSVIYTTRLHALILGFILGKEIYYLDNTTNKLSAFSNTWLKDVSKVKAAKN